MPPKGIPSCRPPFMGTHHMVSSGHWLASVAGLRILREGGNAIDAGVASGIALNVTLPNQTSFGGVAPIVLYRADVDEVVTISGLGRWPRAADLDGYRKRYGGDMPAGIPRSVVPAACDAWLTALELYGAMSFEQVVAPSVELAEQGFPVSSYTAKTLETAKMEKLGHRVTWMDDWTPLAADLCGIAVDRERGILIGGTDARCDNYVAGW